MKNFDITIPVIETTFEELTPQLQKLVAMAPYPEATFKTIAIAARGTDGKELANPISPCGACRQALLEYETLAKHNVPVVLAGEKAIYIFHSVKSLLPYCFSEF